ncbi:MAG TPA: CDP-alcohol phosphatidyltransferase family protein [Pyrinomonadaceae bacterium]|nr:CDP-alcohol phosphatidyltransferase family protein [Pyrinomonadaceae bacterium]
MADEKDNRPPHRGLKKGLYVIPTLFTAANIGMGYWAVLSAIRGFAVISSNPTAAANYFDQGAIAIGLAILFDTLDGRVARATRTATEIGVQFDSLADVLTFGIAPTALLFGWAIAPTFSENTPGYGLGVFLLFAYLMCGAFRLARFNLQATRPQKLIEGATKLDKKAFVGLPIPPAGGLIAAIVHFAPQPLNVYGSQLSHYYTYAILVLVGVLSFLMVSTIRYTSGKGSKPSGRPGFLVVLFIAGIGMLIWFWSQYALLVIAGLYIAHGIVWWLMRPIFVRSRDA